MKFLLDTSSCILLLNRTSPKLARRVLAHPARDFAISIVTAAELLFVVAKSRSTAKNARKVALFRADVATVSLDERTIEMYAAIRSDLERRGVPIGPLDTFIAAHALSLDVTLVTSNLREFRRVRGLRCEAWTD